MEVSSKRVENWTGDGTVLSGPSFLYKRFIWILEAKEFHHFISLSSFSSMQFHFILPASVFFPLIIQILYPLIAFIFSLQPTLHLIFYHLFPFFFLFSCPSFSFCYTFIHVIFLLFCHLLFNQIHAVLLPFVLHTVRKGTKAKYTEGAGRGDQSTNPRRFLDHPHVPIFLLLDGSLARDDTFITKLRVEYNYLASEMDSLPSSIPISWKCLG